MTTLAQEEFDYVQAAIDNAHSLLGNVHCYDSEEYTELAVAGAIMRGLTLEEALAEQNDE